MDDALGFLKQKLNQGLSDVENWGSDVGNDVTHALGTVFGSGNQSQGTQQTTQQQAPAQQNVGGLSLNNPLSLQNQQPQQNQTLKVNLNQSQQAQPGQPPTGQPAQLNTKLVNFNPSQSFIPLKNPNLAAQTVPQQGSIKTNNMPGSFNVTPHPTNQNPGAINSFLGGVGNTIVKPAINQVEQGAKASLGIPRILGGITSFNPTQIEQGVKQLRPLGTEARQLAQSTADIPITAVKSIVSPRTTTTPPLLNNPISHFIFGKQPVPSLQQIGQSAGGGAKGAGAIAGTSAIDLLTLAGLGAGIKGLAGARDVVPPEETPIPEATDPDIKTATDQITKIAQDNNVAPTSIATKIANLPNEEDIARGTKVTSQTNDIPSEFSPEAMVRSGLASNTDEANTLISQLSDDTIKVPRDMDAERASNGVLENGGTREDAVKAYLNEKPQATFKEAAFSVARAARQSKLALHPNPEGINPLAGKLDVEAPKDGDYRQVLQNGNKVENRIANTAKDVESYRNQLTPNDKANFRDYVEGTKDVNSAENPDIVSKAVASARNMLDTVHASDPLPTRYVQNFFPEYWDRSDPDTVAKMRLQAAQDLEEEVGPKAWNNMSLEERANRTEARLQDNFESRNYDLDHETSYHGKARVFANNQEGLAADFKHLNDDPFDDLERYATGAKLDMSAKVIRRSADAADQTESLNKGARKTIDLPGGKSIKVSDKAFKALRSLDIGDPRGPVAKAWQGLTNVVTQFIIVNPYIHGTNLGVQGFIEAGKSPLFPDAEGLLGKLPSGPVGSVKYVGNTIRLLASKDARTAAINRYTADGGHIPTYGKNYKSVISKSLDAAHLPEVNKLNARAMSNIDGLFRSAAHEENVRAGVDPDVSVRRINDFMGDEKAVPEIARNTGLFYHWLRTEVTAIGKTAISPGALASTAAVLGIMYGLNKAWQAFTGNPNATVRYPGDPGLIKEGYTAITKHNAQSLTTPITNHINPIITALANQGFSKDQFTGQKLTTAKQRAQDFFNTTIAPSQNIGKVMSGKKSPAEEALNLFGFTTPHASTNPAAPNIPILNNKTITINGQQVKIKPSPTGDPTGYSQEIAFYNAKDAALNAVGNNPEATDAINAYLDKDVNNKGQKVDHSPQESIGIANLVAGSPQALSALKTFEQSQPNHDPMWDLSPNDLKTFLSYQGTRATDPTKQADTEVDTGFNGGQGLSNFIQQRDAYYNNQPKYPSTSLVNPATPTYPVFKGQQNTDYQTYENTVKGGSSATVSAFLNSHPDVVDAMSQISKYYNALGVAQGGLADKTAPTLTPAQQTALNYYDTLPKDTGARTAWIKANPTLWNQITSTLAQDTLQTVSEQGGINEFAGTTPSQSLLKGISGLGQDIANVNGVYSINPALAYAQGSGSGSSSSSNPLVPLPKIKRGKLPKMKKMRKAKGFRAPHVKKAQRVRVQANGNLHPVQVAKPTAVVKLRAA